MSPSHPAVPHRRMAFFAGARAIFPLVIGAIPFGIIFGALAVAGGVSPAAAMGLSLIVFAGSSQFIGVNLFTAGVALPLIVLTTLVVNVRHALYSATLAPYVRHLPLRWLVLLGFLLTDEAFAITSLHYSREGDRRYKHWFFLGAALTMYINWQITTLIGIIAGSSIPNPQSWGLDFAMTVTFIGIVVPAIVSRPILAAVVTSGIVAVLAYPLPNKLGLIVAALAGVLAGVLAEAIGAARPVTADVPVSTSPTPQDAPQ